MSDPQKPSVGRIVHCCLKTTAGNVTRPGIVTDVNGDTIELCVFTVRGDKPALHPTGDSPQERMTASRQVERGFPTVITATCKQAPDDGTFVPGMWKWPPRV